MNLREGTRRLALLLGVVGAIWGGFASYVDLKTTLEQKTRHNKFEQMASSNVVQQERKRLMDEEKKGIYTSCALQTPSSGSSCFDSVVIGGGIKAIAWDRDRIWNDSFGVYSIETQDGQTLYPTPAPAAWQYFLIALFPVFGFIIPWGTVRAIGWVGAGFFQPSK